MVKMFGTAVLQEDNGKQPYARPEMVHMNTFEHQKPSPIVARNNCRAKSICTC